MNPVGLGANLTLTPIDSSFFVVRKSYNLRTMDVFPEDKIKKKIQETKDYILPLAKEHNLVAYRLLLKEISKWEMKFTL